MLRAWSDGEQQLTDELIRAVYAELRVQARFQLRRERPNHTLNTAALINEAYLKLVAQRSVKWENRHHFFGIASQLMRRVLVDHAKTRHRLKRGGQDENFALEEMAIGAEPAIEALNIDLIALDSALTKLGEIDEQQARIVDLRYFGGLDITETARTLNVSPATVKREWTMAKAWLKRELSREIE
jgi:RNA polymerase sigma factor (TIGR02999 family)